MGRDALVPAAMVCSLLANINRDPERSEPFTPMDFLPGATSQDDDMREFAEAVMRGDKFEVDPEAESAFRRNMITTFRNLTTSEDAALPSEVTNVGPGGKREAFLKQ